MLSNAHAYVFDTTGCVIIKNVLSDQEVALAKECIKNNWPYQIPWKFPVMHLGRIFWSMLTNQFVLDFCTEFCGEHFRLDHAFGLTSNGAFAQLHGGPQSSQHSCYYLQLPHGKRRGIVGQMNFGYCLEPQNSKTGGFVYVPGSHKSADSRAGNEVLSDVYKGNFTDPSLLVPELNPGDLLVFTEALIHGDTGWQASNDSYRMQIYYKMTPGFMCWRDPHQQEIYHHYAANDLERRLIEPPWTGRYSETSMSMGYANERRDKTC